MILIDLSLNATFSPHPNPSSPPSSLDVYFPLRDREIKFSLHRDQGLYDQEISIHQLSTDGSISSAEKIPKRSHVALNGHVYTRHSHKSAWLESGWARTTLDYFDEVPILRGAYTVDDETFNLQSDANYRATRTEDQPDAPKKQTPYMVSWPLTTSPNLHKRDEPSLCGSHDLTPNLDLDFSSFNGTSSPEQQLDRRQRNRVDVSDVIGDTSGCPGTRLIALLGIATDCAYTAQFDSEADVRRHVVSQINTASQLYESAFNVSLRVHELIISNATCPSGDSASPSWNRGCENMSLQISDRLSLFTQWRRDRNDDNNAVWSLLTPCIVGPTAGIAWISTVCKQPSQLARNVANTNVVGRTSAEWQIMAHELGHNFGAVHDCTDETCSSGGSTESGGCCPLSRDTCSANGQFIMNPSTGRQMTNFSPCTIGTVCTMLGRGIVPSDCLRGNEDVQTVTEGRCGNGIVEPGEECDCGGEEGCGDNPCCNPNTCYLTDNAVCDPSSDGCCTNQCQVASSGTVCRESIGPCDPQETCSGDNATCPADEHVPDGRDCGDSNEGLTCASGRCTSRDLQCARALNMSRDAVSACDDSSCQLGCMVSGQNNDQCQTMNTTFLDGTPCGDHGSRCDDGMCRVRRSAVDQWIHDNTAIFVVICVVGGILVLALLGYIIVCTCRRVRTRQANKRQQNDMRQMNMQDSSWQGPMNSQGQMNMGPMSPHGPMNSQRPMNMQGPNWQGPNWQGPNWQGSHQLPRYG